VIVFYTITVDVAPNGSLSPRGRSTVKQADALLPRDQQKLVQAVYDHYRTNAVWPSFDELDRKLGRGRWPLDVAAVARSIPTTILQGVGRPPRPNQEMRLGVEGVALANGGAEDVERFLAALRSMGSAGLLAGQRMAPP